MGEKYSGGPGEMKFSVPKERSYEPRIADEGQRGNYESFDRSFDHSFDSYEPRIADEGQSGIKPKAPKVGKKKIRGDRS